MGTHPSECLIQLIRSFAGLSSRFSAWMSHGDRIEANHPFGFQTIAQTENAPIAAMVDPTRAFYGLQFHPEVEHTEDADQILANFTRNICGCLQRVDNACLSLLEQRHRYRSRSEMNVSSVQSVSGGIDSMVLATLIHQAIGDALVPVFVDNGLLRKERSR